MKALALLLLLPSLSANQSQCVSLGPISNSVNETIMHFCWGNNWNYSNQEQAKRACEAQKSVMQRHSNTQFYCSISTKT